MSIFGSSAYKKAYKKPTKLALGKGLFIQDAPFMVIDDLKDMRLSAGVFDSYEGTRRALAAEFGDYTQDGRRIPPRPFIRPGFDDVIADVPLLNGCVNKVIRNSGRSLRYYTIIGRKLMERIYYYIGKKSLHTPLTPFTIRAKGFDNPLVHTGEMAAHIGFRLYTKGELMATDSIGLKRVRRKFGIAKVKLHMRQMQSVWTRRNISQIRKKRVRRRLLEIKNHDQARLDKLRHK